MPAIHQHRGLVHSLLLSVTALLALTTGCVGGAEPEPRPLTADEAQVFAQTRLRNYDAGVRQASFTVTDQSLTYDIVAWIDFPAHVGYGTATSPDTDEILTLAWGDDWIASRPSNSGELPPLPPETDGWTTSALLPEQSRLHTMLALMFTLGSGQPDNPLLLAQTDARWIREDALTDGTEATVFRGPSADEVDDGDSGQQGTGPLYWISTEDGTLYRMELVLGGTGELVVVEFSDTTDDVQFAEQLSQLGG